VQELQEDEVDVVRSLALEIVESNLPLQNWIRFGEHTSDVSVLQISLVFHG